MESGERFAGALTIVFGALAIGGLMAMNIAIGNKTGFLFALGAATSAWACAPAVLFYKPGLYRILLGLSVAFCVASVIAFV